MPTIAPPVSGRKYHAPPADDSGRAPERGAGEGLLQADYFTASPSGRRRRFGDIQILLDAAADAGGGGLHGVSGQMCVPGGRLDLRVTEQLPDHRQSFASANALEPKECLRS